MPQQLTEWKKAQNLDDAWSYFDPYYPLPSGSRFYVERQDSPIDQLKRALLRQHVAPAKFFFSGFTGSGKSTELNRLIVDRGLGQKYFLVKFSVKETCDPNNLDYVDLLVAIGAKIFETSEQQGVKLNSQVYKELQTWTSRVVERIKDIRIEGAAGVEARIGLPELTKALLSFFGQVTGKIQTESSSRKVIRETLESTLTDLLSRINLIAAAILSQTGRNVLVLVDDLDKANLDDARKLFKDNLSALLQPSFYIVFTVPIWTFFSRDFPEIKRPNAFLLPNVKLHRKDDRAKKDSRGYKIMRDFVTRRMGEELIAKQALNYATQMSGGVFRELARIMQISIDSAIERNAQAVQLHDTERAANELRNEARRILNEDDYAILKRIYERRSYEGIDRVAPLLERLFVLEYVNDENWPDIHPALEEIIKTWRKPSRSRSLPKSS